VRIDSEIERLRHKYECALTEEREATLKFKGENGIMNKKFTVLQKEIEDHKEEIKVRRVNVLDVDIYMYIYVCMYMHRCGYSSVRSRTTRRRSRFLPHRERGREYIADLLMCRCPPNARLRGAKAF
jgi:hypothetical protein